MLLTEALNYTINPIIWGEKAQKPKNFTLNFGHLDPRTQGVIKK